MEALGLPVFSITALSRRNFSLTSSVANQFLYWPARVITMPVWMGKFKMVARRDAVMFFIKPPRFLHFRIWKVVVKRNHAVADVALYANTPRESCGAAKQLYAICKVRTLFTH
jgi:hypothetical protein